MLATAGGFFRVASGADGVGSPDDTYGGEGSTLAIS